LPDFCGQTFQLSLDENGLATLNQSVLNVADNCPGVTLYFTSRTNFTCADLGTTRLMTVYIVDASGNYAVCYFYLQIVDQVAPVAMCQANATVVLGASGAGSLNANTVDAGSVDNCSATTLALDRTVFGCSDIGTPQTVTLTATDAAGNTHTCTTQVTVLDETAPVVTCRNHTLNLGANGSASLTANQVVSSSTDACGVAERSVFPADFTCADIGVQTVTVTATDLHGNSSTCTANVTVQDRFVPTPSFCGTTLDVALGSGGTVALPSYSAITDVADNCTPIQVYFASPNTTFNCSHVGTTRLVTIYFVDGYNNYSVCNTYVRITDPEGHCNTPLVAQPTVGGVEAAVTTRQVSTQDDDAPIGLNVFPNPFQAQVQMEYTLHQSSEVEISIWSTMGQRMNDDKTTLQPAGTHRYQWQPADRAPAGTYFARLMVDGKVVATERLIYMKP
jgi:hypothetical protein